MPAPRMVTPSTSSVSDRSKENVPDWDLDHVARLCVEQCLLQVGLVDRFRRSTVVSGGVVSGGVVSGGVVSAGAVVSSTAVVAEPDSSSLPHEAATRTRAVKRTVVPRIAPR